MLLPLLAEQGGAPPTTAAVVATPRGIALAAEVAAQAEAGAKKKEADEKVSLMFSRPSPVALRPLVFFMLASSITFSSVLV